MPVSGVAAAFLCLSRRHVTVTPTGFATVTPARRPALAIVAIAVSVEIPIVAGVVPHVTR